MNAKDLLDRSDLGLDLCGFYRFPLETGDTGGVTDSRGETFGGKIPPAGIDGTAEEKAKLMERHAQMVVSVLNRAHYEGE